MRTKPLAGNGLVLLAALCGWIAGGATLPPDWRQEQPFEIAAPGLVKLRLPAETLDAARPALEDLRVCDDDGNEVPFLLERPAPKSRVTQPARSFQVSLNPKATLITLENSLTQAIDGVTLESPAAGFIKAVRVEGGADGERWQLLAQGQPVFRQAGGASQLRLGLPPGVWPRLRLTVDDQRSPPIPFTGAQVHAAEYEPAPGEWQPVAITERHEKPGETRLTLNLGAANLDLAAVQLETDEPLFTRTVTLAVPQVIEDSIREQPIGQGTIYRVAIEGQPVSAGLVLPLNRRVAARELLVLIQNQDSPPLGISAARIERRQTYLVFLARAAGTHRLMTGNARCAAPKYDLAALGANLESIAVSPVRFSPLRDHAGYRATEVLAGIADGGAPLDVSAWLYRKSVKITRAGAQQVELDLEVLAHAQPGFQDLRLLRGSNQVPYVIERTSISRLLAPGMTATNDAKDVKLSRWILKLPQPNLPVTRLTCVARTALFQRDATLSEEVTDERGEKYRRTLGSAAWTRTPDRKSQEFTLAFSSQPQSDTLCLEMHNGDNPPLELEQFQLACPVTRLLFRAKAEDAVCLYFGNPQVAAPRYDLGLVAGQLLAADKSSASLAAAEQLRKSPRAGSGMPGKGGVVFWVVLALVVAALLAIISRLLPGTK